MSINQSLRSLLWLVIVSVSLPQAANSLTSPESFAFYYGAEPPLEELRAFDRVILEPDHVKIPPVEADTADSMAQGRWMAYVALGEVNRSRDYFRKIPEEWKLGGNSAWGSTVLDQTAEAWPDFFLLQVITPLWKRGYRGFFLDALDSYELHVKSPEDRALQAEGLVAVIRRVKKAYPSARIMLNRGFNILPQIHELIDAVAFESLFRGWDAGQSQFTEVNEEDRFYLLDKAQNIMKTYGLPVVSIDYVPGADRALMRSTADRIKHLGLIPWVTTPSLDFLGVGSVEVVPRKVLMLYDGAEGLGKDELAIHRNADPMITYLGYVPEHRDIRIAPPKYSLIGRYAGILCWLAPGRNAVSETMNAWLVSQAAQGIKIVFWGETPFTLKSTHAEAFGLRSRHSVVKDTLVKVIQAEKVMNFEMEPLPDARAFRSLQIKSGQPLLRLANARGDTMVAAAYMPWGGFVLAPFLLRTIPMQKQDRWVVQPMNFLVQALQLPVLPAPDVTTENGTRLLMFHVDGDGFANKAEWVPHPYAGEVLETEILKKYPFVTTFSVIEGEVAPHGMYPEHSASLLPIAKRILALPHVEIASHSFSHPFNWNKFARGGAVGRENHLDIKGFLFAPDLMEREVAGSIDYINRELAPPGKSCKVFLWSGNCNPDARTVGLTYAAGVVNMNGGETLISASSDSWTGIAPIGIDKGGNYQVYAPNQNENMYTHEWTGPFYGYENVIKTFEQTDKPIRFKPVDVYYHSYSGSKQASLHALVKIYDWVSQRDFFNLYVSEYTPKVVDFTRIALARSGNAWVIRTAGALKQLRLPATLGYPDMKLSQGIAGYADVGDTRYIHMTGSRGTLILSAKPPAQPFLASANAAVMEWNAGERHLRMTLQGHLNLVFTLGRVNSCQVSSGGVKLNGKTDAGGYFSYRLPAKQAKIEVSCP